jgi:hypothetical protein
MAWVRDVLVSIEHPGGRVGVVVDADEGELWVSADFDGGGTCLSEYTPGFEMLDHDTIVAGGRLPPGAVEATLIDPRGETRRCAVANGAWVAIVPDSDPFEGVPPVRFADASGAIVTPPLPPEWPREPLPDATDDCPACDAREWDVVTAADGSRGYSGRPSGEMTPSQVLVCRRCGHEEAIGTVYGGGYADTGVRVTEEDTRREWDEAWAGADFPVYGVRGRAAWLEAWGTGGGVTDTITVGHDDDLTVETALVDEEDREPPRLLARHALGAGSEWPEAPRVSDAATMLWWNARQRERRRAALQATEGECEIQLDGRPVRFATLGHGDRWAASSIDHDPVVTIVARGGVAPEQLELEAISQPS